MEAIKQTVDVDDVFNLSEKTRNACALITRVVTRERRTLVADVMMDLSLALVAFLRVHSIPIKDSSFLSKISANQNENRKLLLNSPSMSHQHANRDSVHRIRFLSTTHTIVSEDELSVFKEKQTIVYGRR